MNDTCDVLMDTNVILNLIHENDKFTIKLIQDYAKDKKINFIILDEILTEWVAIEHEKYYNSKKRFNHRSQLKYELHPFGRVIEVPTWYNSKESVWVEKMYHSKKYVKRFSRETLSRNDCCLLKYALDNPWTLMTLDHLLIRAYCTESKILGLNQDLLVPKDWVWDD